MTSETTCEHVRDVRCQCGRQWICVGKLITAAPGGLEHHRRPEASVPCSRWNGAEYVPMEPSDGR